MSDLILAAFVIVLAGLFGLAGLSAALAAVRPYSPAASMCIAGAGVVLALAELVGPGVAASMSLPLGPPGQAMHLALDPLAACLLALVFVAGVAIAALGASGTMPGQLVCIGGLVLAALAADAFTLAAGLALASAGGAFVNDRRGASLLLASSGLLVTIALMAPGGAYDAIHAAPPDPMHATAAFLITIAAVAVLAGLVPEPAPKAASLLAAALGPVALGLLLRIGIDLAGPAPPLWWALLPLAIGAAASVRASWRAAAAAELDAIVAALCQGQRGLASIALGAALLAKAADLPELASLAVAASLLLLLTQALCAPLATMTAALIQTGAGSRRIDRLGGLIHLMPIATFALMAGLFGLTALPPSAGFASFYLLFETIMAAPRGVGVLPSLVCAALVLVLALSSALSVTAVVRLVGVACLGRPRTPRAAGARGLPRRTAIVLTAMSGISILLGLLPGPVLWLLADRVLPGLTGASLGSRAGVLHISPSMDAAGYEPLPLAALLAIAGGGLFWFKRRRPQPSGEPVPAWQDGFARPPAWMPFGDPLTQSTGTGFLPPLSVAFRVLVWPAVRLPRLRRLVQAPLAILLVFAAALAFLAIVEAA